VWWCPCYVTVVYVNCWSCHVHGSHSVCLPKPGVTQSHFYYQFITTVHVKIIMLMGTWSDHSGKQCSASTFILLISLTHHMNSHLWWVHAHYSPQLVELRTYVSSPLLSHTPHRRRTGGQRGATQWRVRLDLGGVSQSALWRQRIIFSSLYFIIFVRLSLCNKYIYDIYNIYLYTLCYYMCYSSLAHIWDTPGFIP
jgi:hypothetical protein